MIALLVRVFGQQQRKHIVTLLLSVVGCVLIAAGLWAWTQHLPYTTGLYWAITTATTVGYGDVIPKNASGRLVASLTMLTTIPLLAAAFALITGNAAAAGIRRILNLETQFPEGTYRLVVGMNPSVPAILDELAGTGMPVVLVADVDKVHEGVHLVRGDPTEPAAIKKARPEGAQQALITGNTDGDVLVSAVILRKQAPDLEITALVTSGSVREALNELGVRHAVSTEELVARTLATALETPHAGEMVAELFGARRDFLTELDADQATVGKRLSAIRDERAGLVLGLVHNGQFTLGLGEDPEVAAGDRLLVAEPRGPR